MDEVARHRTVHPEAGDDMPLIMAHRPTGCEDIDHKLIGYVRNDAQARKLI